MRIERVHSQVVVAMAGLALLGTACERDQRPTPDATPPPSAATRGRAAPADADTPATQTAAPADADTPAAQTAAPPLDPRADMELPADHPPIGDAPPLDADADTELPPNHPPLGTAPPSVPQGVPVTGGADAAVDLAGLSLTAPVGWLREPNSGGGMGPVARFTLPAPDDAVRPGGVRITHFPGMAGMNEANIDRWIGQVRGPGGTPLTRDDAKITTRNVGDVKLTVVELSGAVPIGSGGMMSGQGETIENGRLIAAILDHPRGPHFIKISGPSATLEKWAASIDDFLNSAVVTSAPPATEP